MENKLRATLLAMVLFCLLLPMNIGGKTEPSLNYYVNKGSEDAVATSVPVIIEFFGAGMSFFFSNNLTPTVNIALLQLLIWELMLATALLFWNYAILLLPIWLSFLLLTQSKGVRILYWVWLAFASVSSICTSFYINYGYGSGIGFWLNPILLITTFGLEIWLWHQKRRFAIA